MLFKSGYKNVYVSRQFAVKNGMVDAKVSLLSSQPGTGQELTDSTAWDRMDTLA